MDVHSYRHERKEFLKSSHILWALLTLTCIVVSAASLLVSPLFIVALIAVMTSIVVIVKYPFVGLLIYLAVFMLRPGELYPVLETLHIERAIGIMVLVAVLIRQKLVHGHLSFPTDLSTRMLLLFWGLVCASWIISYDRMESQIIIETFLKLIIFYLIVVYEVDTKTKFNIIMAVFVLLIGYIAFAAFRDYYGGGAIYRMGIERAVGRTSAGGDANTLAATLVTTIPLALAFFRLYRHWLIRLTSLGIITLLLIMAVNTGSRSGLLTLFAVLGTIVFFSRYRLICAIAVVILLVAGWFVLPDQYRMRYMTLVDTEQDADERSSGRVAIWENGMRMFFSSPIYGVGSSFRAANASGNFGPAMNMQAHSLYVQLLACYGIVGTLVWFLFLSSLVWKLLRPRPPDSDKEPERGSASDQHSRWFNIMRQAMLGTIAGLLVSGVFGHSLDRYTWYLIASLAVAIEGIYYGIRDNQDNTESLKPAAVIPAGQ